MDKFSVLIPVYNARKYLRECVDSVIAQKDENIEIILVDDGSTDGSDEICDEYAGKHTFVKTVHQQNSGQYIARQTCINNADGKYCLFLDADDWWNSDFLKKVRSIFDKYSCDMVIFDKKDIFEDYSAEDTLPFENEHIFKKEELYKLLLGGSKINNLILKAFKRDLYKDICSDDNLKGTCYGEDALQTAYLIKEAKKVVYLKETLYNYRRGVGVTADVTADRIEKSAYVRMNICNLFEDCNDYDDEIKTMMISFMKRTVKDIIYGYNKNPQVLRSTMKKVTANPYYKKARTVSAGKLNSFENTVIYNAEHERFMLVKIIGILLKIRNDMRKRRNRK